jgi:GAF domain-containing protein
MAAYKAMEGFSNLDHASHDQTTLKPGATPVAAGLRSSAGELSSAVRPSAVRFPGEDAGRSLAEMAQRDLDAALQLLADRAQYITGASGAAIALRRDGRNDMLCRASAGLNAPELGALLSTEFGLSGESVRTRQPLRCDDAERDARVNREVCRELGIASVVVMPVVDDDEVLGVFELFSGKANAFGARDVSAIQRLSEMVETAVRLAQASENLPQRLKRQEASAPAEVEEEQALDGEVLQEIVLEENVLPGNVLEEAVMNQPTLDQPALDQPAREPDSRKAAAETASLEAAKAVEVKSATAAPELVAQPEAAAPAKKPLFWSVALNPAADVARAEAADQSHVPPVLRNLHKCGACGFPVSTGRVLCVECEEKKWRGQLRVPVAGAVQRSMGVAAPAVRPEVRAFAAVAASAPAAATQAATSGVGVLPAKESDLAVTSAVASGPAREVVVSAEPPNPHDPTAGVASPEFILSAGLEPAESWLGANRYKIAVFLVVAATLAAVFFLRH